MDLIRFKSVARNHFLKIHFKSTLNLARCTRCSAPAVTDERWPEHREGERSPSTVCRRWGLSAETKGTNAFISTLRLDPPIMHPTAEHSELATGNGGPAALPRWCRPPHTGRACQSDCATQEVTATEKRTVARQEEAEKGRSRDTDAVESSGEAAHSPTSDLTSWGGSPAREDLVRARWSECKAQRGGRTLVQKNLTAAGIFHLPWRFWQPPRT